MTETQFFQDTENAFASFAGFTIFVTYIVDSSFVQKRDHRTRCLRYMLPASGFS